MRLSTLVLPLVITACSTTQKLPPIPTGHLVPVNSIATAEHLLYESGKMIVGPKRHEPDTRQRLLRRPVDPLRRPYSDDDNATMNDGRIVERTVTVVFPRGGYQFEPTGDQVYHLMLLAAAADRVEIRGRSSDAKFARLRAEAAKQYMLDVGMHSRDIAVTYTIGDPVGSNLSEQGRVSNRRAEIEFFITDSFDTAKRNNCSTSLNIGSEHCGWQIID